MMGSGLRKIAAVVMGFVVASAVMMLVEAINGHVIYPELGKAAAGITDPEAMRALMASAPVGAFLVVALGWILGGLAGGWVSTRLSARASLRPAWTLGVLLTLGGIANNLMLSPPLWFWFVGIPVLLPAAYLGGRLAMAR